MGSGNGSSDKAMSNFKGSLRGGITNRQTAQERLEERQQNQKQVPVTQMDLTGLPQFPVSPTHNQSKKSSFVEGLGGMAKSNGATPKKVSEQIQ